MENLFLCLLSPISVRYYAQRHKEKMRKEENESLGTTINWICRHKDCEDILPSHHFYLWNRYFIEDTREYFLNIFSNLSIFCWRNFKCKFGNIFEFPPFSFWVNRHLWWSTINDVLLKQIIFVIQRRWKILTQIMLQENYTNILYGM